MLLNLGCGADKKPDWLNVDIDGTADVTCDLEQYPWPFDDDSVDGILASHLIEHLHDFKGFMHECHRILRSGGVLEIITPHPLCEWFWQDPTHVRGYTTNTFLIYCTDRIGGWPGYGLDHFSDCVVNERRFTVNDVDAREITAILTK